MSGWIAAAWGTSIIAALIAAFTDLARGKVYNWLTAPVFVLGFVLHALDAGLGGVVISAEGAGAAVVLLLLMALMGRIMGGGDAKLLLATGSLLGPWMLIKAFVIGALAGGLLAVGIALSQRRLAAELAGLGRAVAARVWAGVRFDAYSSSSARIPYAVPLAAGIIGAVILQMGGVGL